MNKFYEFMRGRYGADELCAVCVVLALILQIILSLFDVWWLSLIPLVPVAWTLYRMLSRNIVARRRENQVIAEIKAFAKLCINRIRDRRTHVYFKCLSCKTTLRLPRNKGDVSVTCPKCQAKMRMHT